MKIKIIAVLLCFLLLFLSSCNRKNKIYEDALRSAFEIKYGLAIDVLESWNSAGRTEAIVQLSRNHEFEFWVSVDKNNEDLQDDFFIKYTENEIKKSIEKHVLDYFDSSINFYVLVDIYMASSEQAGSFYETNSIDEILNYLSEEDVIDISIFIEKSEEKQNQDEIASNDFLEYSLKKREKTYVKIFYVDNDKIEEMKNNNL